MKKENAYDSWSFVERQWNQDHWYIRLEGGKYHGVVFKYDSIKLNETTESIDFDYDVVDYLDEDPHGKREFNMVVGDLLKHVLDDAFKHDDFVIGSKNG